MDLNLKPGYLNTGKFECGEIRRSVLEYTSRIYKPKMPNLEGNCKLHSSWTTYPMLFMETLPDDFCCLIARFPLRGPLTRIRTPRIVPDGLGN